MTLTSAQRTNARQDKIWETAKRLDPEKFAASDIDAALELVISLAFQNTTDRHDNPREYRRQMAALKLVRETFSKSGE